MRLVPQGVLIIWDWSWHEESQESSDSSSDAAEGTNPYLQSDSDSDSDSAPPPETFTLPAQTHIVTFKCMGTTYDLHSQETLKKAGQLLTQGVNVPVKLVPEPENDFDANAIAFYSCIDKAWHRIGYVVKEALDHVYKAILEKTIIYVKFSWVKYRVMWLRSGPGYYAGVNIAINGEWPPVVVRHASTC